MMFDGYIIVITEVYVWKKSIECPKVLMKWIKIINRQEK